MYYSKAHDWQNASNVKQILVFPVSQDLIEFEKNLIDEEGRKIPHTDSQFNDADVAGVFVKLRAVLNSDDRWIPIIRTADGTLIKEFDLHFKEWEDAIDYAKNLSKL